MGGRPLDRYPLIHATDENVAREKMYSAYGTEKFEVVDADRGFGLIANQLQFRSIGLSYCEYLAQVKVGFPQSTVVRQFFNISGSARWSGGRMSEDIVPETTSSIVPAEDPLNIEFQPYYRHFVLRIEEDALSKNLEILLDAKSDRPLVFAKKDVRERQGAENLRRRIFHVALDANSRGALFSEVAAAEIERMIIMNFLFCNENSYTSLLLRNPPSASKSVVDRVEEYIAAHPDQLLDLGTLALVAGVSLRTLLRQFRIERSYSPHAFVTRTRLQRAYERLACPDETATVTQVALKTGFNNLGHFANNYRTAFGELPSETLARASSR